jgi:DeoR/GlpR family transcriptional regulator of sugar metabolism
MARQDVTKIATGAAWVNSRKAVNGRKMSSQFNQFSAEKSFFMNEGVAAQGVCGELS